VIVVSDASPLIALAAVEQLDLLRQLYVEVLIPEAVYREATTVRDAPGAAEVSAVKWVHVQSVRDRVLIEALAVELDVGEAEAIALAVERGADLLLIDERRGRQAAARLGQQVVGVLGVLIEAKYRGHLPAVRPVLEALATGAGFRVSDALYSRVLEVAGE
jgi:predicted nucleic acid-binding protein